MKQLEVQIMGQSYLLGCPENGDARMLDAVNRVDMAMCRIRDAGKIKARDRIAVLAALNLAFELPERTANAAPAPLAAPVEVDGSGAQKEHPQLTTLLQRLDTALGIDGRLL
ncbi:cell division protein ZapA [Polaromonas sp. YR568]|uniref:cell division protein ZapA n=1 Tax=Polaromonas sp. YR568 TaxID=1855301 RepID=UPI0008EF0DE4|nr:cell division protein ZapA [Polaromonas sp. YR568]SFU52588.1 cell division protein ZapA [Polaromonas sp. YR568]